MPKYAWVCYVCERTNVAGSNICSECGISASATGSEIEAARRKAIVHVQASTGPSAAAPTSEVQPSVRREQPSALVAFICIGFGGLCLVGSYQAFAGGHWPAYMPPQLDLLAVPLSWLSEKLGAYVGGALAGLLGFVLVLGGLLSAKREDAA